MTDDHTTILHTAMGAFEQYNAHLNYSTRDALLKLVTDPLGNVVGRQRSLQSLLLTVSSSLNYTLRPQIWSFLNLLLVRTEDFLVKYFEWLSHLATLNLRVRALENLAGLGVPLKLHKGLVIYSAIDDTENKVKEQFGGHKWKRVMNFPLLQSEMYKCTNTSCANNGNTYRGRACPTCGVTGEHVAPTDIGVRGGESFVSLVRDNIPNHQHGLSVDKSSAGDVWKTNRRGTHPFTTTTAPGLSWGSKLVYPEISMLNWNEDAETGNTLPETGDSRPTQGATRYVKPHFNIPPYKDVYIWTCDQVNDPAAMGSGAVSQQLPTVSFDPTTVVTVNTRPASAVETHNETEFSQLLVMSDTLKKSIFTSGLNSLTALNSYQTFVSDELAGEAGIRYDSKDALLTDMADLVDWYVWCETMHVETQYLFKDVYKYLIEDIQDRIYLLVNRISAALGQSGHLAQRVMKGQYVFLYGVQNEQEVLSTYYKLPYGLTFVKVSNVFLRGTSMFTQETQGLFDEYVQLETDDNKRLQKEDVTVSGGLSTVNLYADNFPKHLHWSTLLGGMESVSVSSPADAQTGGVGSGMMMNDPRSGGFKYHTTNGSGPYKVSIQKYGRAAAISHNNMPKYITMSVYLVS